MLMVITQVWLCCLEVEYDKKKREFEFKDCKWRLPIECIQQLVLTYEGSNDNRLIAMTFISDKVKQN